MSLDTTNFSSDPQAGDNYKNYRRACQAAIKDINAVLAPTPKMNFMMPTAGMGEVIIAHVGACVGTDGQGNPIWTNPAAANLAQDTIDLYSWLIAQVPAQLVAEGAPAEVETQTPEVATAETPDLDVAPAMEQQEQAPPTETQAEPNMVAEGQECPGWDKKVGPKPGAPECTTEACARFAACAERAAKVKKPKKTAEEKEAEKAAKAQAKAEAKETKKKEREAAKAAGKGTGIQKASGPGVIGSIFEFLKAGPCTKVDLLAKLKERYPERSEDSMKATINVQIPSRMAKEKKVTISKNEAGQYFIQG